jgi:hypothetical protein
MLISLLKRFLYRSPAISFQLNLPHFHVKDPEVLGDLGTGILQEKGV